MYKLYKGSINGSDYIVKTNENGSTTSFTQSKDNTDYQAYLKYKEEGGKVYGPDEEVPSGQTSK